MTPFGKPQDEIGHDVIVPDFVLGFAEGRHGTNAPRKGLYKNLS